MRKLLSFVAALSIVLSFAVAAEAQVARPKVRWVMEFKLLGKQKPDIFEYTDPLRKTTNYWYIWFELTNNSVANQNENAPTIYFDMMFHTAHGRMLESDVRTIDPKFAEHRGQYNPCIVPDPAVEQRIIRRLADMGNVNEGVYLDRLEQWKKEGRFLNISEIHRLGHLKPGQKITGIAIFDHIDPYARQFEFLVSGYKYFIKTVGFKNGRQHELENETMSFTYNFPGDPTQREEDVVEVISPMPEIQVRRIGPVSSKETLEFLIDMMVEGVRQERAAAKLPPAERENAPEGGPKRDPGLITPMDMRIAGNFLSRSIDGMQKELTYRYDPSKSVLENEQIVWRWHEWWIRNVHLVQYDEAKEIFILSSEPFPGAKEPGQ